MPLPCAVLRGQRLQDQLIPVEFLEMLARRCRRERLRVAIAQPVTALLVAPLAVPR